MQSCVTMNALEENYVVQLALLDFWKVRKSLIR